MKIVSLCLLVCLAAAERRQPKDEASQEARPWTSAENTLLDAAAAAASQGYGLALSSEADDDYDSDLDLDSEEDAGRSGEDVAAPEAEQQYVLGAGEYSGEYLDEDEDEAERIKRKVIFGGGGGYGGVHRSRSGGGGGDPYGRRRGNHNYHGPDYGNYGSWPYGRGDYVDTSSYDNQQPDEPETTTTTTTIAPPTRVPQRSRAYGIVRASPADRDRDVPSTSGRKSKTGRRETKRKLSKNLKWEIAEYALKHGTRQAVHHYQQEVGKRISEKKIEKFVRRYQQRQERTEARQN